LFIPEFLPNQVGKVRDPAGGGQGGPIAAAGRGLETEGSFAELVGDAATTAT